jgi:aryl-alcohol dehydrogenase-like predicted oxidoreductase
MHRMVAVIRESSRAAVRNRSHYDPVVEQLKKRMASLKTQLRQLKYQHKTKYVDLMGIEQKVNETATKIDRLKDEGRALGYGLSQFESGEVELDVAALDVDDNDDDIVFDEDE